MNISHNLSVKHCYSECFLRFVVSSVRVRCATPFDPLCPAVGDAMTPRTHVAQPRASPCASRDPDHCGEGIACRAGRSSPDMTEISVTECTSSKTTRTEKFRTCSRIKAGLARNKASGRIKPRVNILRAPTYDPRRCPHGGGYPSNRPDLSLIN